MDHAFEGLEAALQVCKFFRRLFDERRSLFQLFRKLLPFLTDPAEVFLEMQHPWA